MKKTISTILAVITLLMTFIPANACRVATVAAPAEETATATDAIPVYDPTEGTAIMYLCATAESPTGHVWLYFVNNSNIDVQVGYIILAPGESMSVGSLRNTRTDGGGTYYNAEAYMAARKANVTALTISMKMELTWTQLEQVSGMIKSMNSYNAIGWNCGNFATKIWNSVSSKRIVHICFPIITIIEMLLKGGKFGDVEMDKPDISDCYKQTSNGVKSANSSSFNISCV